MSKNANNGEKSALASKKFVAFLVCELGFFLLMGIMLFEQEIGALGENVAFMVLAINAAFMGVGYVLGQAYIDKFTRVASITMGRGDPEEPK